LTENDGPIYVKVEQDGLAAFAMAGDRLIAGLVDEAARNSKPGRP
jgi:hypothetical protein